ncbi:helix-turn-helix domain-containing protein [Streptomyces sp. NPDC020965]|uniref:helix-turn-helix domain-containing protein n=1 Tax=Streptomyces sp. NPDC020965 TaxID=3365105 RepID=UPI0037A97FFF
MAIELHAIAVELVEAELNGADLHAVLAKITQLTREADYYALAAVHDARATGHTWEEIAEAAGAGTDAVRAQFSQNRTKRLFAHRARQERPGWTPQIGRRRKGAPEPENNSTTKTMMPTKKLGSALSYLQRMSDVPVGEAARLADLSPSYLSRILAGERLPAWPVTHMLTTILGGSPEEVRPLWESASGIRHPTRQDEDNAVRRLHAALRGLHLAAARPNTDSLAKGTGLSAELLDAVLKGDHVPDWPTTALIATRLTADPALIKPLWEAVHYAFLASREVFPAGGIPFQDLAPNDPDDQTGPPRPHS